MDVRVFYEDTDAGGIVYYVNYLKFFERIRTLYLEKGGFLVAGQLKEKIHFVVTEANVKYLSSAELSDILEVSISTKKVGGASILHTYRIVEQATKRLVVTGETTICLLGANEKPARIPEGLRGYLGKNPEYS